MRQNGEGHLSRKSRLSRKWEEFAGDSEEMADHLREAFGSLALLSRERVREDLPTLEHRDACRQTEDY